jgi:hypothetical protein
MIGKQLTGSLVLLLFAGVMTACLGETRKLKPKGQHRRYAEGPLQISDFQAKHPDHTRSAAYTAVRVRLRYRYGTQTQNGQISVRLESINVFSVFVRDQSWWAPLADKRLLDHEQGHFDIAEACARRAQLHFNAMFERDAPLTASGQTTSDAARQLARKIERLLRHFNDAATLAHQEYDRITHHGNLLRTQAEQRRVQKATLNRLAKQLARPHNSPAESTNEETRE